MPGAADLDVVCVRHRLVLVSVVQEMAPVDVGLDAELQGKTRAADSVVVRGLAAQEAREHLVLFLGYPGGVS